MLKLLERNIRCVEKRLVLLAPAEANVPAAFNNVEADPDEHRRLLEETQRLRGSVYLSDGAVERRQLSAGGLHRTAEDPSSWHLLMLNAERRVSACIWYLEHANDTDMSRLRVRDTPLARHDEWREPLKRAVASELGQARHDGLPYAEVGGWAVTKESRCTSEGLLLALAAYSLGRFFGGALGMTTATVRHSSSTILRRIGGASLRAGEKTIPSYFDPRYKCEMELLRFDSRRPSPKYNGLIDLLHHQLASVPVVSARAAEAAAEGRSMWQMLLDPLFDTDMPFGEPAPAGA
jgi:hypothetical protein